MLSLCSIALAYAAAWPSIQEPDEVERVLSSVSWTQGPGSADIGTWATIQVPSEHLYAGAADTQRLLEMMQNPISGHELGFLAADDLEWFAVFEFDASGYVKDDEKAELDAGNILAALRDANDEGNEEREKRGWTTLEIEGWAVPPHYDETTHNLEWATTARASAGSKVVNHNTRLLGRRGVMNVTLVVDPEQLAAVLPEYKAALSDFEFKSGQAYGEFVTGDKVAEYGLTALVAGGAGALAVKSGLFGKLWKLLVVGAIAVAGFVKRLFLRGRPAAS
jgi:uncharacterized membrane-anchored protein